ncbi:hypothetical protein NN561_014947 [Cricetulus griseus]
MYTCECEGWDVQVALKRKQGAGTWQRLAARRFSGARIAVYCPSPSTMFPYVPVPAILSSSEERRAPGLLSVTSVDLFQELSRGVSDKRGQPQPTDSRQFPPGGARTLRPFGGVSTGRRCSPPLAVGLRGERPIISPAA